jgi:hypothetical protein
MTVELLLEVVALLLFGSVSFALSIAGLYVERFAFATYQSGRVALGTWPAVLGLVLATFSYLLGRNQLAPTVASVRARRSDTR